MLTPFGYFDLIETLPQPGCVVCNLLLRDADRFLSGFLYEFVTDPDIHRIFRASRGFCNAHSWQLRQYRGGSLGIAILYSAALDEVLGIMQQESGRAGTSFNLGRLLPNARHDGSPLAESLEPTRSCLACETLAKNAQSYARTFAENISDTKLTDAYRESDGLCLAHFRQVLQQPLNAERLDLLVSIQRQIWQRLQEDLDTFIKKARLREAGEHEPMTASQGDSWTRVIARLAGEKGVSDVDSN